MGMDNERVVDRISELVLAVLLDNGWLTFDETEWPDARTVEQQAEGFKKFDCSCSKDPLAR